MSVVDEGFFCVDVPIGGSAMGKRLSDAPYSINEHGDTVINFDIMGLAHGLAEIKRMEALKGKAPCLARLDELAAWSAKDD